MEKNLAESSIESLASTSVIGTTPSPAQPRSVLETTVMTLDFTPKKSSTPKSSEVATVQPKSRKRSRQIDLAAKSPKKTSMRVRFVGKSSDAVDDAEERIDTRSNGGRYNLREPQPYKPYFFFNEAVRSSYELVAVNPVMHDRDGAALRKFMKENRVKNKQIEVSKDFAIDQFIPDKEKLKMAKRLVAERNRMSRKMCLIQWGDK